MKPLATILAVGFTLAISSPALSQGLPDFPIGTGSAQGVGPELVVTSPLSTWRSNLSFLLNGAMSEATLADSPWIVRLASRSVAIRNRPAREAGREGVRQVADRRR